MNSSHPPLHLYSATWDILALIQIPKPKFKTIDSACQFLFQAIYLPIFPPRFDVRKEWATQNYGRISLHGDCRLFNKAKEETFYSLMLFPFYLARRLELLSLRLFASLSSSLSPLHRVCLALSSSFSACRVFRWECFELSLSLPLVSLLNLFCVPSSLFLNLSSHCLSTAFFFILCQYWKESSLLSFEQFSRGSILKISFFGISSDALDN